MCARRMLGSAGLACLLSVTAVALSTGRLLDDYPTDVSGGISADNGHFEPIAPGPRTIRNRCWAPRCSARRSMPLPNRCCSRERRNGVGKSSGVAVDVAEVGLHPQRVGVIGAELGFCQFEPRLKQGNRLFELPHGPVRHAQPVLAVDVRVLSPAASDPVSHAPAWPPPAFAARRRPAAGVARLPPDRRIRSARVCG
jgi:hypothetical protein